MGFSSGKRGVFLLSPRSIQPGLTTTLIRPSAGFALEDSAAEALPRKVSVAQRSSEDHLHQVVLKETKYWVLSHPAADPWRAFSTHRDTAMEQERYLRRLYPRVRLLLQRNQLAENYPVTP
ncbi:hypothetical protein SKAU_G00195060 [Synaphobranchus kaupii]|uniref:Uncharacterized protein n=1 Tax=Synaphobranchus kaupii TaxID=118154 RepID=A0A9Q1FED2_SYNKA|nr:hypothetical protein SKAU_G00195060 [Synaphobranchus kaupii]